ncbi:BPL-N domain-containing protein [Pseudonocardia sp.]|uniref:BPL-N domain-containing protein n=1 Tax=Pseudonocardia sp. TaxID=60912 RepID=UPI0026280404|nr:BPL-N domain-containing protein [Pseudonocardia sp.]
MGGLALVYRGPAARPEGCPEAVAELLRSSPHGFDVRYVGPKEELRLRPEVLARAAVYAQPGGGELRPAYRRLRRHRRAVRDHVAAGGVYLGFCLGGYLAGATPGFRLIPGDTDRWTGGGRGPVDGGRDTTVEVRWRGHPRRMFFQDGARFLVPPGAADVQVLARYPDGAVAALTAPFGAGAVGVVGPHPEAGPDWYRDAGLRAPARPTTDLGHDLIDATLDVADRRPTGSRP